MRRRSFAVLAVAVSACLPALGAASCGSGNGSSASTGGGGGAGASGGGGGTSSDHGGSGAGGSSAAFMTDSGSCDNGKTCGDGGVCAGGKCCEASSACGDTCCDGADVCSFQKCVKPGAECHDSSDCPDGDYCELSLGDGSDAGPPDGSCLGGSNQATGKCLPKPPICKGDAGAGNDCLEACEFHPTGKFDPVVKASWGGDITSPFDSDIMMTPIVIELDDDDCDGKVTERDIPEIVFTTFSAGNYGAAGTLHAISLVNGAFVDKWSVPGVVNGTKQIAGGDFDGNPGNEVVACGADGKVYAFKGTDGSVLWSTASAMTCFMPSIADLDGDGHPEVIVEGGILDGATGALKAAFSPALDTSFVVSDIDGDGKLDIVTGTRGYHADGTVFVDTMIATASYVYGTQDWKSPWPAIADFDHDGKPEVVVIDNLAHTLFVWRYDAAQPNKFTLVRGPIDINAGFPSNPCSGWGATHGGGPPTVADFNGDGVPDVGTASGIGYVVFDGKKLVDANVAGPATVLWSQPTHDCSSASTGSSVFDFDGDGKAEVVYSDELHLRIYDGTTGNVLFSACNTTATLIEDPIIADVDNDGHADIVVVSNAYAETCPDDNSRQSGIRVFGDANGTWVRTRRVWNEHAYHVTNVNEDGTIPAHEATNWTQAGLDNFRQNKQPGSEFAAPDAVVSLAAQCGSPYTLVATVRNVGEAALPAGVVVGFYAAGSPATKLGQGTTTRTLYPAESEAIALPLPGVDPGIVRGTTKVFAVVDDTTTPHPSWTECRTDNDSSAPAALGCGAPK